MKKIFLIMLALMFCFVNFIACDNRDSNDVETKSISISVQSVTLSQSELTMKVNDKIAINASIRPLEIKEELVWTSSNTAVADYINGSIVAFGAGNCVIKATASNGVYGSCFVSVSNPSIVATNVSFPESVFYAGVGSIVSMKLQITPNLLDDYSGSVTSSNNSVVQANYSNDINAKVTMKCISEGQSNVMVTLAGGKSATVKMIVVDLDKLVKIDIPSLPLNVEYTYVRSYPLSNHTYSRAKIEGVEFEKIFENKNSVKVTVKIRGTKTYDDEGTGSETVRFYSELYKENDVFASKERCYINNLYVGQTFTYTYSFYVAIDDNMTPREFVLKIKSHLS